MVGRRIFYVTQESLTVFGSGGSGSEHHFADDNEGIEAFDAYLAERPEEPSVLLLDVIEEVFVADTVPKLAGGDRRALLARRAERKFPRTPFRMSVFAGKKALAAGEDTAVHSAVSNHELLECWLQLIARHKVPLKGIYSVPLLAADMLPRLRKLKGPVLFLTHHQGDKLRQVFLRDGCVLSARLSQCPGVESAENAEIVNQEIDRSRRYLERSRLLGAMEELHVCIVASAAQAQAIVEARQDDAPLSLHVVSHRTAAARLGLPEEPDVEHLEALYLAQLRRRLPRYSYAASGEDRYWRLHRLRQSLIGGAMAASLVCSVLAGGYAGSALRLADDTAAIERQVAQLTSTLRQDNALYSPIHAGSHEMKLAVDTGDYILANRVPVPWVLIELSRVLESHPDVRVTRMSWSAAEPVSTQPARRQAQVQSVPVAPVSRVEARLGAVLEGHDADLRAGFRRIEMLAEAFRRDSRFNDVAVLQYPIDASPTAAVSGEIGGTADDDGLRFELRLSYVLPTPVGGSDTTEADDDTV